MFSRVVDALAPLLGRRTMWRLGRALYMKARGDPPRLIDMRSSGEESLQRQFLGHFAKSDERLVIFDVGANVGDWTWFLLDEASRLGMGDRLQVHAFEPVPSTFQTLQRRIGNHPLARAACAVPQALSSTGHATDMFIVEDGAGTNSLHLDPMNPGLQRVRIEATTADDYCASHDLETIHFLKCDTEGHDIEVLRGARRMFDEQRVVVCQFEYNLRWVYSRHFLKDVFDYVANTPYRVGKVTPRGVETYRAWHPELEKFFEGNYVLLRSDAVRWFSIVDGEFDRFNTYSTAHPTAW